MVSHWCIGIVVSEILKFEYLHLLFTNEFFIVKLTVDFSLGNFSEVPKYSLPKVLLSDVLLKHLCINNVELSGITNLSANEEILFIHSAMST